MTTTTTKAQIALQLYSVRREVEEDVAGSLLRVREAGFTAVELYNIVSWKDDLARELTANGLSAPTAHARLTEGNQGAILEAAAELGVETIIDPFINASRWTSPAEVDQIASDLNDLADQAKSYGLNLAYHNHQWELENRFKGQSALEYLAERLSDRVSLEVDTYWAAVGGADVPTLLKTLGNRVRFLHLKDAPLTPDGGLSHDRFDQVPVGEGALSWDDILRAAPDAELYVVEFDEFRGDVIDASARSLTTLVSWGATA